MSKQHWILYVDWGYSERGIIGLTDSFTTAEAFIAQNPFENCAAKAPVLTRPESLPEKGKYEYLD